MAPYLDPPSHGENTVTIRERLCQIVTPVGNLGYGFVESEVETELEHLTGLVSPTAIILDSGSTDSGPSRLALGVTAVPRSHYERDIGKLVKLSIKYSVPLIISSAGGAGLDGQVDLFLDIIEKLAEAPENRSWKLEVLAIYAGLSNERVSARLRLGQITGCGSAVPALTQEDIDATPRIVGQMGPEPFLQAMIENPDFNIIVGGRAYDPAPYIAFCAYHRLGRKSADLNSLSPETLGAFAHMGKIMECGGACATPKSIGASAYVYDNATFDLVPLTANAKCNPLSVAAHCLYEKSRPDILHGPGGYLDLTKATYKQLDDQRTTSVSGAIFHTSRAQGVPYTVKLEGGKVSGYRTIFIGSFCDPTLVGSIDSFFARVKDYVKFQHKNVSESWDLDFHIYGLNRDFSTLSNSQPYYGHRGVFIVGEAQGESQALATSVASTARVACIHGPYPGQKATSGNFGFGIGGKNEIEMAETTEFSIYHLISLENGEEGAFHAPSHEEGIAATEDGKPMFHWTVETFGRRENEPQTEQSSAEATSLPSLKGTKRDQDYQIVNFEALPDAKNPRYLADIAPVVRSKNSGPYEITIDIIFSTESAYQSVKESRILSPSAVAELYDISEAEIIYCGFFDQALAFKFTFPRKRNGKNTASGGYMEFDMHGSQQYTPLLKLPLSEELVRRLASDTNQEIHIGEGPISF